MKYLKAEPAAAVQFILFDFYSNAMQFCLYEVRALRQKVSQTPIQTFKNVCQCMRVNLQHSLVI